MSQIVAQDAEETITCQFCKKFTPADINFCVECDMQIKCLECGKKTFQGKDYCLYCSKPLAVRKLGSQAPNHYLRTVEQDGDRLKEHTEFSLSDKSVAEIAPFVVGQILPNNKRVGSNPSLPPQTDEAVTSAVDITQKQGSSPNVESNNTQPVKEQAVNSPKELRFFAEDDGFLIATIKDFKGKTWADQQKNFLLLYIFYYRLVFNKPIPNDEHLKSAAEKADIVDKNNFTSHIKNIHSGYLMPFAGGFILNEDGVKRANEIISLIDNNQIPEGNKYWSRNKTSSAPATPRIKEEDRRKVKEWAAEKVELGKLDVLELKSAREYAMFAIWSITIALKKGDSVKRGEAFYYLSTKYANISVKSEAFLRAVDNNRPKYFESNPTDGSNYLTKLSQQIVEDWVSGKSKPSSAEINPA